MLLASTLLSSDRMIHNFTFMGAISSVVFFNNLENSITIKC